MHVWGEVGPARRLQLERARLVPLLVTLAHLERVCHWVRARRILNERRLLRLLRCSLE